MKKILFLLILSSLAYAKSYEPTTIDRQILSYTYNEEFDQAKSLAQEQIKLNRNSPKYYYYLINAKIMEYYKRVAELSPENRDEGRKAINKEIIDYCENVIDKFEDAKLNLEDKFYYGSIYGYLARVYGLDRSWWSAFKSGKNAEDIMNEVLKADSSFYDAYLVLGMLNYYADRLSGITSFVAGILGYSGDRDKGLNQLKTAYEKGKFTFAQSALTLIEVYTNLEDNEYVAKKYYESFLKMYPYNSRILNAYCHELMGIGEIKKVETIIQNDNRNLIEDYTKARYYNMTGNSQLAIQFGEKALESNNQLWHGAGNYVRYIIVFNSWLIGDNTRVKKYEHDLTDRFQEAFTMDKKYPAESRWLSKLSVKISLSDSVDDIETFVKAKPTFNNAPGYNDQFNLLMGTFYFRNDLFEKAQEYLNKITDAKDEGVRYGSLKCLIQIYLQQNINKTKVESLLDNVDDLDNDRLKYMAKDLAKKYNL